MDEKNKQASNPDPSDAVEYARRTLDSNLD
jgi:hypothetical protein